MDRIFQIVQSEPAISTPATLKSIEKRIAAAKKFETVCHAFVSSPDNINAAKALAKELGYKMLPTFEALVESLSSRLQTAIDLPMTMTCLLEWEKQDVTAINKADRATLRTFHQNNQTRRASGLIHGRERHPN